MRTTINLPDDLADEIRVHLGERSFSDFAREALAARVAQIEAERLACSMREGYQAEAANCSLEEGWSGIETEGW